MPFRTNPPGLRDQPYPFEKPDGTLRVAVIGDSYTMASGVAIENAFHSVLERRFAEAASRSPVEFLNFGVGGYSLRHYLAVLRERVGRYDPDLVLIAYCGDNDHRPMPPDYADIPFEPRPRRGGYFTSHLRRFLVNLAASPPTPGITEHQAAYIDELLGDIANASRELDLPVVIAYLSNRPEQPETVARAARAPGLPWVNASERFEGTDVSEYSIYFPLDTHPNAVAHAIFADAIYEFLSDREFGRD